MPKDKDSTPEQDAHRDAIFSKVNPMDVFAEPAAATPEPQEDVRPDPSPDAAAAADQAPDPDAALPFGKHPRWQEVKRERDEARRQAEAAQAERDRIREEAAQLREDRARLAHLDYLDRYFRDNPEKLARTERLAELADTFGPGEPEPTNAVEAEVRLLRQQVRKIEADRLQQERTYRGNQVFQSQVVEIAVELEKANWPMEDRDEMGSTIHAKWRMNRERGLNVTLQQVAKSVLDHQSAREGRAVERFKTAKQAAPAGAPDQTLKKGGGRVPISPEAERDRSSLVRDKETGKLRVDWSKADRDFARHLDSSGR